MPHCVNYDLPSHTPSLFSLKPWPHWHLQSPCKSWPTFTHSIHVLPKALATLTPVVTRQVDASGPFAFTFLACAVHVTLIDVAVAFISGPPRQAQASCDGITVTGSHIAGTVTAAVGSIGSRQTSWKQRIQSVLTIGFSPLGHRFSPWRWNYWFHKIYHIFWFITVFNYHTIASILHLSWRKLNDAFFVDLVHMKVASVSEKGKESHKNNNNNNNNKKPQRQRPSLLTNKKNS